MNEKQKQCRKKAKGGTKQKTAVFRMTTDPPAAHQKSRDY